MKISGIRKYTLYITYIVLQLTMASGCREKTTEPEAPKIGKRNYTWTVDTLSYPASSQTSMFAIWGSSPSDVYVVGHNSLGKGIMYRFDGRSWSPVPLRTREGGQITRAFDLFAICGFSPADIWSVGESHAISSPDASIIIHFNGQAWTEASIEPGKELYTIWGAHAGDIWAGGASGTLYHFVGSHWSMLDFDTLQSFISITGFGDSDIFATTSKKVDWVDPIDTAQYFLFHYDGAKWSAVDSIWEGAGGEHTFGLHLWASENQTLYSAGLGVYRTGRDLTWKKVLTHDWWLKLGGSNSYNIFAVGPISWNVFHWNGADWKLLSTPLSEYTPGAFTAVWTNNRETFFVGSMAEKTIVMHGK